MEKIKNRLTDKQAFTLANSVKERAPTFAGLTYKKVAKLMSEEHGFMVTEGNIEKAVKVAEVTWSKPRPSRGGGSRMRTESASCHSKARSISRVLFFVLEQLNIAQELHPGLLDSLLKIAEIKAEEPEQQLPLPE